MSYIQFARLLRCKCVLQLHLCRLQAVRSSSKGLFPARRGMAAGSRARPTVELRVSVRNGVAFQMDHHPMEVCSDDGLLICEMYVVKYCALERCPVPALCWACSC